MALLEASEKHSQTLREKDEVNLNLKETIRLKDKELLEKQAGYAAAESALQEEIKNLKTDVFRTENRIKELNTALSDLNISLETEKKKAASEAERLNGIITEKQNLIEEFRRRQESLQSSLTESQNQAAELQESLNRSNEEKENLRRDLQLRIQAFEKERSDLMKMHSDAEALYQEELKELSSNMENLRRELSTREDKILRLEQSITALNQKTDSLQAELNESAKTIEDLIRISGEKDLTIREKDSEAAGLQETIKSLKNDLVRAAETEAGLHSRISSLKDQEFLLQHTIKKNEEKIRNQAAEIEEAGNTVKNLEEIADQLNGRIAALTQNLNESRKKEQQTESDLKAALARERNSREEGAVITDIMEALGEKDGLESKVNVFLEKAPLSTEALRLALYRISEDGMYLEFAGGFLGKESLFSLKAGRQPLEKTSFGESLATGRPKVINFTSEDPFADMPGLGIKLTNQFGRENIEKAGAFAVFPLKEAGRMNGVMTISMPSHDFFPEGAVRMIGHLSSLISVALKHDTNAYRVTEYSAKHKALMALQHFIQRRLRKGFTENTQETQNFLPVSEDFHTSDFYTAWLSGLLDRNFTGSGTSYETDIQTRSLQAISERISGRENLLYWITAEAVRNIREHAQAKNIEITLKNEIEGTVLRICDDGEGLLRTAGSMNPEKGEGLSAIRNSALILGGELRLERGLRGYGVSVIICWPE